MTAGRRGGDPTGDPNALPWPRTDDFTSQKQEAMHAIVITTHGDARDIDLPDEAHHAEIRRILGGHPDRAV
ncbi:hypothetical protein SAMN05414137_14515 [Streptacidiphilus jiangxiensis]|uniref:Uncharacterized protein n=1 Tax=Streptacidiphilus jiangxiensis TaxID=235985 RepID=A0A1H8AJ84_STRJI|nr:hypothetical protein SAMN05414137_14515 [Streptacidiphilus jiangxiensis]